MNESENTTKDLKLTITSKLNVTEDQKQKFKNFMKALKELPETLDLKISLDGGKTYGEKGLKLNLYSLIGDLYFNENN